MNVEWLALVISIVALVTTMINMYLQYYKVELCPYVESRDGMLYLIVENNSANLAKDYTIKLTEIAAPREIEEQLKKMRLLDGTASFNLAPKKTLDIFIGTHVEAYMKSTNSFPKLQIQFFNAKKKLVSTFTVDFSMLKSWVFVESNEQRARKELGKIKDAINNISKKQ